MRAMILAAGRGERMGSLTDRLPKPLLRVGDSYLIEYTLKALKKAGYSDIVINVCYRAKQIKEALGNGQAYGVNIEYSEEESALETGGGIFKALPLLGDQPFLVVSCDIVSNYPLASLPFDLLGLAHLVLVNNPDFHPTGDFCLLDKYISYGPEKRLTFGNIGIYRPELFEGCQPGRFPLNEVFQQKIPNKQITGEHFDGFWHNVGTAEQLELVRKEINFL